MYNKTESTLLKAITEITGMGEDDSTFMALLVAAYAAVDDLAVRSVVQRFLIHCVGEIEAYLKYGALPDWFEDGAALCFISGSMTQKKAKA